MKNIVDRKAKTKVKIKLKVKKMKLLIGLIFNNQKYENIWSQWNWQCLKDVNQHLKSLSNPNNKVRMFK